VAKTSRRASGGGGAPIKIAPARIDANALKVPVNWATSSVIGRHPHSLSPALSAESPILQAVFRLQTGPRMLAMGPSTSPHGQLHVWRAKNGSTSVHPDLGPRAACAAALEERAGAHLTVRVHERARRAVRARCSCQLAITGRGLVLRAHPIEVAGRPRRRGRASSRPAPARSDRPSLRRKGRVTRWVQHPASCKQNNGLHHARPTSLGNQLARKISLVWRRGTGRRNEFQVFAKSSESAVKQSQPGNVIVQCRLVAQTAR
jgi:hypothetical protein